LVTYFKDEVMRTGQVISVEQRALAIGADDVRSTSDIDDLTSARGKIGITEQTNYSVCQNRNSRSDESIDERARSAFCSGEYDSTEPD
jgi:hypothetical protein